MESQVIVILLITAGIMEIKRLHHFDYFISVVSISSATLCSPIPPNSTAAVPIPYPQIIVPQGTFPCEGQISQLRLRVEGEGPQTIHVQLLGEGDYSDEYVLLDVEIFLNESPVNGVVTLTSDGGITVVEDSVIGIYTDNSKWRVLHNTSTPDTFFVSNISSTRLFNNLTEVDGQPLVEVIFTNQGSTTGQDPPAGDGSVLIAILIIVVLLVLLIVVAIVILVVLVKKTRQRVVVLKQPSEENPTYTRRKFITRFLYESQMG